MPPGRKDAPRYAFHRGDTFIGQPPQAQPGQQQQGQANAPADAKKAEDLPSLETNLKTLNEANQLQQLERLQERFQPAPESGAGLGGFQ